VLLLAAVEVSRLVPGRPQVVQMEAAVASPSQPAVWVLALVVVQRQRVSARR
jgi:hypothetical protein